MTQSFEARYHEELNPVWRGNPLITALNPVCSDSEFLQLVAHLPPMDVEERQLPAHYRRSVLCRCEEVFVPFEHHLLLYQRLNRLLRVGYEKRNPCVDLNQDKLDRRVDEFQATLKYGLAPYHSKSVEGFALTGTSGLGKSTAVRSVLRTLPQVLHHTEYQGRMLNTHQLVWLMLDCPEDGSLKSLCKAFFAAIDQLFDQNYSMQYAKDSYSVSQMLPHLARVAALTHLGVLIIDETQNLGAKRSQGADVMLGFFTRLANTIGVPVLLVGTPEAQEILTRELHQVRRNSGQGEMQLQPLQGKDWQRYIENISDYQFLREPQPLSEGLGDTLHALSRGVVGFATKIFIVAQERALNLNQETLTSDLLNAVAVSDFGNAVQKLRQLYGGETLPSKAATQTEPPSPDSPPTQRPTVKKKKKTDATSGPAECQPLGAAEMLSTAKAALLNNQSVYEALSAANFMKNSSEFYD